MSRKDVPDSLVVRAFNDCTKAKSERCRIDVLVSLTGQPFKVCLRACERAADNGLIDCGVSLRFGWVTAAGLELLRKTSY